MAKAVHIAWAGVLAYAVLAAVGCSTPAPKYPGADLLRFDARMTWVDVEGGFWALLSADGTRFQPPALPRRFHREGLQVHVVARPLGSVTTRMWGQPIRVMSIHSLQTAPAETATPESGADGDGPAAEAGARPDGE